MPRKTLNLVGETYSRLLVLEEVEPTIRPNGIKRRRWLCRCSCGEEIVANQSNLRTGTTNSCGCYHRDAARKSNTTHNMTSSKEFLVWVGIKNRCLNPNQDSYKYYGGRGIKICDQWVNSFETFHQDMGPRPSPTSTIERRDTNGDYCKDNCYWLDKSLQYKTCSHTKLNDDLVRYIRKQRAAGVSGLALAEELGVSNATIYKVASGKTWKDVT